MDEARTIPIILIEENSFHGQEIKGYEYSNPAIIIRGNSLLKGAVKEEWLTSVADGKVQDGPFFREDSNPEPVPSF